MKKLRYFWMYDFHFWASEVLYRVKTLVNQGHWQVLTLCTANDFPGKDPLEKPPEVGLEGSEGSFQVKKALERPIRPL